MKYKDFAMRAIVNTKKKAADVMASLPLYSSDPALYNTMNDFIDTTKGTLEVLRQLIETNEYNNNVFRNNLFGKKTEK